MDEVKNALIEYASALEKRYGELTELIEAPEILGDSKLWQKYARERSDIERIALLYRKFKELNELYELYKREADNAESSLIADDIEEILNELALSSCGNGGERSRVILEIRSANRESGFFASDLLKAYAAFAKGKDFSFTIESEDRYPDGYVKEASVKVEGISAYDYLLHESGIHRAELTGGKSATVTIAVYNAPDESDYSIKEDDVKIDLFHSSGAGGQNINKVETAVRARHIPTGIMVVCKDERSQLMNRNRATEELKERVRAYYAKLRNDIYLEGKEKARSFNQRIRVYDYKNGKLTDVRLNATVPYKSGNDSLNEILTALKLRRI